MEDIFDTLMKSFLAQMNSSLKISKIISEHSGEEELSEDSIVCGLVYRLMTPMEKEDIDESIENASKLYDNLTSYDSDSNDEDGVEDEQILEELTLRKVKTNNCNCEVCIQSRVCLLNYKNHEPKDQLEVMYKNAIENACEKGKLYI